MNEENMSILALMTNASFLVQAVMGILFIASIMSWIMIVQRGIFLNGAQRSFREFEDTFWSGVDLNKLYQELTDRALQNGAIDGIENVFRAGFREFNRLAQTDKADPDAVMEGTDRAMRVALSREDEKLSANLPFLASVASVSPYIGLFGTVWGIMNSFRGLAMVQQATLATVAPGISEALIATAMGLFAAIPAVIAYNRYSAKAEVINANYETFSEEFSSILHRQVHAR
ncbi:protein TolQ [Porticoccaceae bacterium]|nr:protein TolQ [Porticoccaceae bacterium]MDB4109456.1 protein TolQ [Porticoccaceae bacterium]MDC0134150.1 protein TolQ [Porticoccaceae bacterium]MDC1477682.1 protein TolQ [Porticoccaceae bacterium]CAI8277039.1 MAG: Biopolymer transport protein ExbB [SAR92 bacterium MED-G29]